jgi:hypothetical protein
LQSYNFLMFILGAIDMANGSPAPGAPQQTYVPTNKTIGATVGSALGVIVVWLINTYVVKEPLPVGIEGAITVLITFILGYFVPHGAKETIIVAPDGSEKAAVKP